MSDEKRNRNPWEDRYGQEDDTDSETSQESNPSKTTKTSKTAETAVTSEEAESSKTSETGKTPTVRDRKNVNMYLPEALVSQLQLRYSELETEWRRKHDDELPKNEVFYPAVIRAALEETSIEAEIGLEEE